MATIEPYETKAGTRYRVRYRTPDQRQTDKRGFKTKRDAKIFANTVEVRKLTGDYIAPSDGRVPLATVAKTWFARQLHVKPSWAARQESIYRVHIEPKWGTWNVAAIDRPAIQDWIAELDKAPSTVADIHNVLAGILDEAVDERRIPANPARGVNLPRRSLVEHAYLDHTQVLQLIREVTRPEIVSLLAYAGPRWGEMAALRPMDVDLDRGRIHIRRSASKVNQRSEIVAPKTWEQRTIAIPEVTALLLEPVVAAAPRKESLLWNRRDGTPIMPPTSTHWFTLGVKRLRGDDPDEDMDADARKEFEAGRFPRVSAHELRHTAASLMIASGAHVKTVQRQLGHKSATMTLDTYGHLFADDLGDIVGRLDAEIAAAECGQNVGTVVEEHDGVT